MKIIAGSRLTIPRLRDWKPMMRIPLNRCLLTARTNGQADGREAALRNESPQLSAQLFAPEDSLKAAVNLICLAGDVARRKTIGEIANRGKPRAEGKIALSCIFRIRIGSYAPCPFTIPIMKPLALSLSLSRLEPFATVYFSIVIACLPSRLPTDFLD